MTNFGSFGNFAIIPCLFKKKFSSFKYFYSYLITSFDLFLVLIQKCIGNQALKEKSKYIVALYGYAH